MASFATKPGEVGFAEDPDRLSRCDELLGLPVLRALLETGEPVDILISDNKKRCPLGNSRLHRTSEPCGQGGRLPPRDRQRTRKNDRLAEEGAVRIPLPRNLRGGAIDDRPTYEGKSARNIHLGLSQRGNQNMAAGLCVLERMMVLEAVADPLGKRLEAVAAPRDIRPDASRHLRRVEPLKAGSGTPAMAQARPKATLSQGP